MTTATDRFITLSVGIAIGMVIMFVLATRPEQSEEIKITPNPRIASNMVSPIAAEAQVAAAENNRTQPTSEIEPRTAISPILLPPAYEDHIRPKRRQVSFADIHNLFKNEPRDEPWAAAMESGINHYLANSGSGDWAVVEYVECRARICEIAGYRTGTENHPKELVDEFVSSGIWHGNPRVHLDRFGEQDIKRFMIAISSYSDEEYRSALPPD